MLHLSLLIPSIFFHSCLLGSIFHPLLDRWRIVLKIILKATTVTTRIIKYNQKKSMQNSSRTMMLSIFIIITILYFISILSNPSISTEKFTIYIETELMHLLKQAHFLKQGKIFDPSIWVLYFQLQFKRGIISKHGNGRSYFVYFPKRLWYISVKI